ncbi:MAG: sulfotransferase [Gammaproteobacteria bacterium]|nr:sulfotransferase [Gammaproteobacteria bacterium]
MADDIAKTLQSALASHRAGELAQAERLYREVLRQQPDHAQALLLLADIAQRSGHGDVAADMVEKVWHNHPTNADYCLHLAQLRLQSERYREAITAFRNVLALRPDSSEACRGLAQALQASGDHKGAITTYERALVINDRDATAVYALGNLHMNIGNLEAARHCFERTLDLVPGYARGYYALAMVRRCRGRDDKYLQRIQQQLQHDALTSEDRMLLSFALGKASEDIGDNDAAFAAWQQGNRLKRESYQYAISSDLEIFSRLQQTFSTEFFRQRADYGSHEPTPVFIVGMPRSGTSLVEQIIASHPLVYGAGELGTLKQTIFAPLKQLSITTLGPQLAALSRIDVGLMADMYLKQLRALAPHALRITDKMPLNFVWLGMVQLMFPEARIIHCRRDPVDVCLSCFKQLFDEDLLFAYDLDELGQYCHGYQGLMKHWHQVMPGRILDVQYEDVVDDLEGQARRLIDHCGLPWDDACLAFHQAERSVITASVAQVRQPVYRSSLQRWRQYESHLGPLQQALGLFAGSDE